MKPLEMFVLLLVVFSAVGGMYYLYKDSGRAVARIDVEVVISGGMPYPSSFVLEKDGRFVAVTNEDSLTYEVEIVKVGRQERVVYRRDVRPGKTTTPFVANSGEYKVFL